MEANATIEQRLAALELAVAELIKRSDAQAPQGIMAMAGSMRGVEGFDELVEIMREAREADRRAVEAEFAARSEDAA